MIYIIHLVCCLHCLELYWLDYDNFSKGSEDRLKRPGTLRVKTRSSAGGAIIDNISLTIFANFLFYYRRNKKIIHLVLVSN